MNPVLPIFFIILLAPSFAGDAGAAGAVRVGEHPAAGRDVESQQESDWVDNRWSRTEVGQFLGSNLEVPGGKIAKGLTVKVGPNDEGAVAYDTGSCTWRAAWLGGFLKFSPSRFGLIVAPKIGGAVAFSAPATPGWQGAAVHYRGLYPRGKRVVLEYTVGEGRVLESPWLELANSEPVFIRQFEFAPATEELNLTLAAGVERDSVSTPAPGLGWMTAHQGANAVVVAFKGADAVFRIDQKKVTLAIARHRETLRLKVMLWRGNPHEMPALLDSFKASGELDDLGALVATPAPPRWLPELKTVGRRGLATDILAVDTLTVPYDNPWKALMFLAGVDFTSDGTAYVCTIHGDVWRVTGIDDTLRELKWKRFATGLFQALGLKIRNDEVFVLGRDRITRLHDRNGDGEADFYESFCDSIDTSTSGHDYVTSLERDNVGNFYYVDPRGAHRVSVDGVRNEVLSTGFRNANGLGASPDGKIITVAPQQGEWTPSSCIVETKPGGYYGYGGPKVTAQRPLGYDAPLCWIPHSIDNSSGSQVWIPKGVWGPLGEQMLHLLWGRCGMMLVLQDRVNDVPQGAVIPLPARFLSGPNRGSFNSRDGHLYIAGSTGWQTSAAKDGALQRVRFTGKPVNLPIAWHAHSNGLTLTFARPLDRSTAEDTGSYAIKQWNYRYAASYGSEDWSVANPNKQGHDEVEVKSARLLPDGRTMFLEIPSLRRVMQMEIKYNLNNSDGSSLRSQLWLTLNALDTVRH